MSIVNPKQDNALEIPNKISEFFKIGIIVYAPDLTKKYINL